MTNPFPGLRPFEPDEDHLFFGREKETDDLLRRLGSHRFLTVVGTSGSGKSSLVRSGLIPSLQSGLMTKAGSSWRIAIMRPGEDPMGHLVEALDAPGVLGADDSELTTTNHALMEATLRRGTRGLVDTVRLAKIPSYDNVLILVDQFEELFRFRRSRPADSSGDESIAFVKLLLQASAQREVPIYVVLTMRSDFIGDGMDYPGLPEAINEGQYLVPRMTRDELRLAITGPVAVGGATIAPRLVLQLLNEIGDERDHLPVLQHVLMRTWDRWAGRNAPKEPLDIADYEAVGTLRDALSVHADEAFAEVGTAERKGIAEKLFKALTDTLTERRGIRRPASVADLAAIGETSQETIASIVEIFRRPGRSFLMPPSSVPLTSEVIVDLSHESLMRGWKRLIKWAREERDSTRQYLRLARQAAGFEAGTAGLWGDPELELALRWRRSIRPTAAWAKRFNDGFERSMDFLERSRKERDRRKAEIKALRRRNLYMAWGAALVLLVAFAIAALAWSYARSAQVRAEESFAAAKKAVDETLVAADRDPLLMGAEVPQLNEFRRELLDRVKTFYTEFLRRQPQDTQLVNEVALAHLRLGHIHRMTDAPEEAIEEYQEAVARFEQLAKANRGSPEYRESLGGAYTWLGETMRPLRDKYAAAEQAYNDAFTVQTELTREFPANMAYRQQLARTRYDRGILRWQNANPGEPAFTNAEEDFRAAVEILQPVAAGNPSPTLQQDLARALNNLANLKSERGEPDAPAFFELAIASHERLAADYPKNREYRLELATFSGNLGWLLLGAGDLHAAERHNDRARVLLDDLARAQPSLGIEQADAYTLQARILQSRGSPNSPSAYRRALDLFQYVAAAPNAAARGDFRLRLNDFLLNLASLCAEQPSTSSARPVLKDAFGLALELRRQGLSQGDALASQALSDGLSAALAALPERDRRMLASSFTELRQLKVDR